MSFIVQKSLTFSDIRELKMIKGLALHDIITEVHKFVQRSKLFTLNVYYIYCFIYISVEFPFELLIHLLNKMAEIEYRLCSGANENIQLTALISAFQATKEITPPE